MEVWKPAHNFPAYICSTEGRIKNVRTQHILSPASQANGVSKVCLRNNNRQYTVQTHRLIAETFLGPHPNMDVRHRNEDLSDNRVENLYWSNHSDTIREAYSRGSKRPYQSIAVRVVETGDIYDSIKKCSASLGCDPSYIRQCLSGERKNVKGLHIERL